MEDVFFGIALFGCLLLAIEVIRIEKRVRILEEQT